LCNVHTKSHPQFPGLLPQFGQKLTLGVLATITLEVAPFHAHTPFSALLPFLMHTGFCFDYLNYVKMAAFQFYRQSGKQENVRWVGENSHVVFGQITLVKREV
jgi:hypothetical protein